MKIQIPLPASWPFATELDVRIGDINYGGHLANDAVLALAHEARLRYLRSMGFTEKDAGGAALIMSDAAVEYRGQVFHGDRLRVEVAPAAFSRAGFDLVYRFSDAASGREAARVKTGLVFFDYERNRPVRMPEAFRAAIAPGG